MLRKLTIVLVLAAAAAYFFLLAEPEGGGGLVLYDPAVDGGGSALETVSQEVEVPAHALRRGDSLDAPQPRARISGRVVLIDGTPVAGVHVRQEHPYLVADPDVSASDGTFELEVEEPRGELAVGAGPWLLLGGERYLAAGHLDGYTLVVTAARAVHGRVTDRTGSPLRGVTVAVIAPNDVLVPLGIVSTPLRDARQSAVTDAQGIFRIEAAPMLTGTRIEAALTGYQTIDKPLASVGDDELELILLGH